MAQELRNRPCGGRYGDIIQAIGNTPLVELKRLSPKPGVRIWAKLESHNPTGSVKDRVARALIEDAEEKGAIRPGQTILEPTSGNTGISLAMICSRKGYPLKVVMPDNVTPERTQLLKMYGAEIVYSPGDQGSNGAVAMALEMAAADASYYMPYQYGNQANPNAHYHGTAPEIIEELDEVTAFVAGLGTGGTLMGNGRRLREEYGDAVKIVAAEPMQGEPVQGLRSLDDGFIPPIIDLSLLDRKIFVTNHDAIVHSRTTPCISSRICAYRSGGMAAFAAACIGAWTSIRSMNSSGESAAHGSVRRSISMELASPSNRSRTVSSIAHSSILGWSGSGSEYLRPTSKICRAVLSGDQAVMPTVLPGRTTLNSSSATTRGRGAIMAPNTEPAHSNRPSSNGRSSASATTHSIS